MLKKLSNDINRYYFNNYHDNEKIPLTHYIDTSEELNDKEIALIRTILFSFPHVNNSDWPNTFLMIDYKKFPSKLLVMAANAYDSYGNTVLGVVAEHGESLEAAQLLINMGADIEALNHENASYYVKEQPVIYWAINNRLSYEDRESYEAAKIVAFLLEHNAKTNFACRGYATLLEYAISKGFKAAAALIEKKNQTTGLQQSDKPKETLHNSKSKDIKNNSNKKFIEFFNSVPEILTTLDNNLSDDNCSLSCSRIDPQT